MCLFNGRQRNPADAGKQGKKEEFSVRKTILATSLMALAAGPAVAGGIERSNQSMAILFEEGNYLEFGASYTDPRVTGRENAGLGGNSSGNMSKSFWNLDLRFRGQINEQLSYAIIIDQPIGANLAYPTGTGYQLEGSKGTIRSTALTGVLRYEFGNGFSAYGGLRAVRTSGSVNLPAANYKMSISPDTAYGYLVGVAYERPEIAARVSLTYNSAITHRFKATETSVVWGGDASTKFSTTIPESVHLEFQTGIMEDTLLFGGIRWVRWSKFDITPKTLRYRFTFRWRWLGSRFARQLQETHHHIHAWYWPSVQRKLVRLGERLA